MREVICPYCGKQAEFVSSQEVYRKNYGMIYLCRDCDAFVGCHSGSDRPLGRLADARLREYKKRAHSCFDRIWKCHFMARSQAYKWLAEAMNLSGQETHIGMFNISQCQQVIQFADKKFKALLESRYGENTK